MARPDEELRKYPAWTLEPDGRDFTVILNARWLSSVSDPSVIHVICHELAHVARWDLSEHAVDKLTHSWGFLPEAAAYAQELVALTACQPPSSLEPGH